MPEIVWLIERRHFAVLVTRGAYYSVVKYNRDNFEYEEEIENSDYEFWEETIFDYECDE